MIAYIFQTTICLCAFYLIYLVFLKKETFFSINRWYLLGTVLLSLFIPILPELLRYSSTPMLYTSIEPVAISIHDISMSLEQESGLQFHWMDVVLGIYAIGVIVQFVRLSKGLIEIYQLYRTGKRQPIGELQLVFSEKPHLPFSFFGVLFMHKDHQLARKDFDKILKHEAAHAKQWHSLDVLLFEVLGVVLWMNPMIYFYRKSIREVHEYLADAAVLQTASLKPYGKLLLTQSGSSLQMALANQFFQSQLKNRIKMMTKKRSSRWATLKYLAIVPILLLTIGLFSYNQPVKATPNGDVSLDAFTTLVDTIPSKVKPNKEAMKLSPVGKALTEVDEMPRYPGCEDQADEESIKNCATKRLLEHIYKNVKYPATARKAGVEGKAVASFVVGVDGRLSDILIKKALHPDIDAEVLRVINSMNALPDPWIPGVKDNKIVPVEMAIPVKFLLSDGSQNQVNTDKEVKLEFGPEVVVVGYGEKKTEMDIDAVIVLDGKVVQKPVMEKLDPKDIATIDVVKGESAEAEREKYGDQVENGIVYIRTKGYAEKYKKIHKEKESSDDVKQADNALINLNKMEAVIVIDGVKSQKPIDGELNPDDIATVNVVKNPSDSELKEYGTQSENGIIYIVTKKHLKETGKKNATSDQAPEEIFKVVEEMPRFPGCENDGLEGQELTSCAQQKMLKYIFTNLKYPKEARTAGIQGMVVAQFVVRRDGSIDNTKIIRSIGGGTDEEVLRVVKSMNDMDELWTPGKQRGRNVDVQLTLPVKFKITEDEEKELKQEIDQMPKTLQLDDFVVQPNPSSGVINVRFKAPSDQQLLLYVFDMNGKMVHSRLTGSGAVNEEVDLSGEAKGNYVLKLVQGKEQFQTMIQIQ